VAVDDPNNSCALKGLGIRLEWDLFLERVCRRQVNEIEIKNLFYDSVQPPLSAPRNPFLEMMRNFGFETIDVPKKIHGHNAARANGKRAKSQTDQMITVYLMQYLRYNRFDKLVIFTGDSDFRFVLDVIQKDGKKIIIVSSQANLARELREFGKVILLDNFVNSEYVFPASTREEKEARRRAG
jgi:uncharacterized LabA/DUF88 family protein